MEGNSLHLLEKYNDAINMFNKDININPKLI